MHRKTIRLESEADRWRYVCPNGHRSWEPTNRHYWCQACAGSYNDDCDSSFHCLTDKKAGDELPREAVRLVTSAGPYEDVATDAGV